MAGGWEGGREGGIGGLVGGIFMRGNKSKFLRQSTLYSLLYTYTYIYIYKCLALGLSRCKHFFLFEYCRYLEM